MAQRRAARRFAPVGMQNANKDAQRLEGVVFDMDGTLCEPQNHMFAEMRSALGIDKSTDILDHIYALPTADQPGAHAKIEAIERKAMAEQIPQPGLERLLAFLDKHGVRKAICTRNFDAPVLNLVSNHVPAHIVPFDPIVTRGFKPPKPSPAGILHIAKAWGVVSSDELLPTSGDRHADVPMLMVGDSIDDIVAGYDAGAVTVLLRSPGKEELEEDERTDVAVDRLDDLVRILEEGLVVKPRGN